MKENYLFEVPLRKNLINFILESWRDRSYFISREHKADIILDLMEYIKGNIWIVYMSKYSFSEIEGDITNYCINNKEKLEAELNQLKSRYYQKDQVGTPIDILEKLIGTYSIE
jgi:hypothetical protein